MDTVLSRQNSAVAGQQPSCPMLFAPWYFGHHPSYLRHLIVHWQQQQLPGTLSVVVMPSFRQHHPGLVAQAESNSGPSSAVHFVVMTAEDQKTLEAQTSGLGCALVQYELIGRYASQLQATHCLLMHLDSCLIPFVLGRRLPCAFSGIYFRPTFHYSRFAGYKPTWKERAQQWREQIFLSQFLRHSQLKTLFCLDPLAVEPINQRSPRRSALHLPDPVALEVAPSDEVAALRQQLGIEPGRRVFLAFGSLAEARKGTQPLLKAVQLLQPQLWQNICLLLVGEPFPERQALLETWLAPLRRLPVQIVTRFGYLPESTISCFFQLADVVLAPYQKHVGMSGILLQAAVAQKPVLSSSYGLMGELVERYGLGLAVDTTSPAEIAMGLAQCLHESVQLGDPDRMQAFAAANSVSRFSEAILQQLCSANSQTPESQFDG